MSGVFSNTEYEKLTESIFSRHQSVQKVSISEGYKPGLDRMIAFSGLLGHPEKAFHSIHVAGTNGKGSVSNMLASCLSSAGMKTGLYTSPHILNFRERARISSAGGVEMVPKEYVYEFLNRYSAEIDRMGLSFFEITTALAFKWFADSGVDVAVIEAGLGGRLDSTNILTPDLSIVTSIGLDHCEWLGDTLGKIASEKAGIFKSGVPALVGESDPETSPVFLEKAGTLSSLVFADHMNPTLWNISDRILSKMDLRGCYQRSNLRTVLTALDILRSNHFYAPLMDFDVETAIEKTASIMDFHGRWERLSECPDVICDIGHNAPALKHNFAQLKNIMSEGTYSSLVMVYGVMADKDLDGILPLMPSGATWIFTTPKTSRALPAERIAARYRDYCSAHGLKTPGIYVADSVTEAVEMAMRLDNQLIYIGGSTFVVAEAIPLFAKRK